MAKILMFEDNEINQDLAKRRLEKQGHEVFIRDNGKSCVKDVETVQPDLILMDISLPEKDGWQITQEIKSFEHLKNIPIIALTAHAMEEVRDKAFQLGFSDFESKPIDFPTLFEKINRYIALAS